MNKRIVINIIVVILIIVLGIVLINEFRGDSKGNGNHPAQSQEQSAGQETEESQKPIDIKDNKDDGFSELIPLKPVGP